MLEFSNYWLKYSNDLGRVYHSPQKKARKIFAYRVNFWTGRIRSANPPLFSGAAKKEETKRAIVCRMKMSGRAAKIRSPRRKRGGRENEELPWTKI